MFKHIAIAVSACTFLAAAAQDSPYAGQQTRSIKALSDQEIADLAAGQGMGLAKAAELNGYPGPAHVLEFAVALGLTTQQREATRQLFEAHKARARLLGQDLLEAERALDRAFGSRQIDAPALSRLMDEIGRKQALLREEHLRTHLAQTAVLAPHQVEQYSALRGYSSSESVPPGHRRAHPHARP
jgi:Spy/CpxP family protein refolding chaperone